MKTSETDFLQEVLGTAGYAALKKAIDYEPEIGSVVVPRAMLSWLDAQTEYEGAVPGFEDSQASIKKSVKGFSGTIRVGTETHEFDNASVFRVAASIAHFTGTGPVNPDPELRDQVLVKLGKSIDSLVKAQIELEKKVLEPSSGIRMEHEHHDLGGGDMLTHVKAIHPNGSVIGETVLSHKVGQSRMRPEDITVHPEHRRKGIASAMYSHAENVTGKTVTPSTAQTEAGQALWAGNKVRPQFGKAEPTATTAKPIKQLAPTAPIPPGKFDEKAQTIAKPKLPKLPSLSITKSEAARECPMCGGHQLESNQFRGCVCFGDLQKSVKTTTYKDGYVLDFSADTDRAVARALLKFFKEPSE